MFDSDNEILDFLRRGGVVDTHYHVGPELVMRRYNVKTLADCARPYNAALVLKNHTYATTALASLARAEFGVDFYGGVVLNHYVGGLNPEAVVGAVSGNKADVTAARPDASPVVVWMPTVDAASHIETFGFGFDPKWSGCCVSDSCHAGHTSEAAPGAEPYRRDPVVAFSAASDGLRPTAELIAVLETLAANGCVLATGHLSAAEVLRLVPLAVEMGVRRIILTHPHYPSVRLSDAELRQLVGFENVYIEHCFAIHTQDGVALEHFADSICFTGPERVVLSTDFGQINSEGFPDGTLTYMKAMARLLKGRISERDFLDMFTANGRRALGMDAVFQEPDFTASA